MKKISAFPSLLFSTICALGLITSAVRAQFSYQTPTSTLNIVAGLSDVVTGQTGWPNVSAPYLTDQNLTTGAGYIGKYSSGATLSGNFGGGTFFRDQHQIIVISGRPFGLSSIRLLLSDGTYSPTLSGASFSLVRNNYTRFDAYLFDGADGLHIDVIGPGILKDTYYQIISLNEFDIADIGVKGVEFSNLELTQPSITYVGVAEAVPEPSTYALLLLSGAASLVALRRRKTPTR